MVAIARLCMKVGKAGKASPHAAYIARIGTYARIIEKDEKLEAAEAGNMPTWASDPLQFWLASDAYERKNGTTYREMEIALPRALSREQRIELVRDWVAQEIGERYAFQWAIHNKIASDGGEQPHVHFMFSERQIDGIDRDPEQYFKRYNSKYPERGGARKGYGPSAGKTLNKEQRASELKDLRNRWEIMCNAHLEKVGHDERIDMRSYAAQGVDKTPERKHLPSEWRKSELRASKMELANAKQALEALIPHLALEIQLHESQALATVMQPERAVKNAVAERRDAVTRELARHLLQQQSKERVTAIGAELTREREKLDIMPSGWMTEQGRKALDQLAKEKKALQQLEQQRAVIIKAQEQWREAHPLLAWVGWKSREAWDLEYALEELREQETVATKRLQTAERGWSAAQTADTQAWRQENKTRHQRIQALESELERIDWKSKRQEPVREQASEPRLEPELPNSDYDRPEV